MKANRISLQTVFIACLAAIGLLATLSAQSVSTLDIPWVKNARGRNLFFQLDGSGDRVFINRSSRGEKEEIIEVSLRTRAEKTWLVSPGLSIYDRFDVSADAGTLVFARVTEGCVYVVRSAGAKPVKIADVAPDRDPRQLQLTADGRFLAFTAGRLVCSGSSGSLKCHLYVAATDGSGLYRITPAPFTGRYLAFSVSSDGSSVTWIDDLKKGPLVADVKGRTTQRLPYSGGPISNVFWKAGTSEVFCQTADAAGVKLVAAAPNRSKPIEAYRAASGDFLVARGAPVVAVLRREAGRPPQVTAWLLGTGRPAKMLEFSDTGYEGCGAWSRNGNVLVWRDVASPVGDRTLVWRRSP